MFKTLFSIALILVSCQKPILHNNPTFNYLNHAELQIEDEQKDNLILLLHDMQTLSSEEIKAKRYKDYTGVENAWDAPTMIEKYFLSQVPDSDLRSTFYQDIKTPEVQEEIQIILKNLTRAR